MKRKKKNTELYGIIGLGRFGFALAQTLAEAGREIMVIDNNEDKIKEASVFTDNAFVVSSLNKETLEAIGLQDCDTVAVCIGEAIDTSILTTLTVLQLGIKKVISKAISFEHGTVLERLGAQVVYPERDMAVRVANRLLAPQMMEYISLSKEIDISEIRLTDVMEGRTVLELGLRREYGLNIIAINQNDTITTDIVPGLVLHADNSIVVVGRKENIRRFEAYLNN